VKNDFGYLEQSEYRFAMLATAKAIAIVNQLKEEGVISAYAVGGAIGALFYIEPTQTQDIDIFVHLNPKPGSLLVTIEPILDRLEELGFTLWEEDKVVVAGWPIQFLPATKAIEIEAIAHAKPEPLADGIVAFVPPAEYLMAMAIDLGRPKDMIRLQCFYEQRVFDPNQLDALLEKHQLSSKWQRYLSQF